MTCDEVDFNIQFCVLSYSSSLGANQISAKELEKMEEQHVNNIRDTLEGIGINPDDNFFTAPKYKGTSSGTVGFPTRTGITAQTIMDFISKDKKRRSDAKTKVKDLYETDLRNNPS